MSAQDRSHIATNGGTDGSISVIANAMDRMTRTNETTAAGTTAALQNIAMINTTYLALHRMPMDPSKKDVEDSCTELMVNLTS